MSFGSFYYRDSVTYQVTTRHPISKEMIPAGDPITTKAKVSWYGLIRGNDEGNSPKQFAIIHMDKREEIKTGDIIKKIVFESGDIEEREYRVQRVAPNGGLTITHKEVWI